MLNDQKAVNEKQNVVNETLMKNTNPTRIRDKCQASKIKSEYGDVFFNCRWVPLPQTSRLRTYGNANKSKIIFDEVVRYSTVMRDRLFLKDVDEKRFVQPEIRNVFWPNTCQVLNCHAFVELFNERRYEVQLEKNSMIVTFKGQTDHTVKMTTCDFNILTIEDKNVGKVMHKGDLSQAVCEMVKELSELKETFSYVPVEYCGILQNGKSWKFLYHKLICGVPVWQHVVAPDTFKSGVVDIKSCKVVARLLEHAYCVADDLFAWISKPLRAVTATFANTAESSDGGDDDDGDDDGDEGDDGDGDDDGIDLNIEGLRITIPSTTTAPTTARRGSAPHQQKSRDTGGAKKRMMDGEYYGCDENQWLPPTFANMVKQPIQHKLLF